MIIDLEAYKAALESPLRQPCTCRLTGVCLTCRAWSILIDRIEKQGVRFKAPQR